MFFTATLIFAIIIAFAILLLGAYLIVERIIYCRRLGLRLKEKENKKKIIKQFLKRNKPKLEAWLLKKIKNKKKST